MMDSVKGVRNKVGGGGDSLVKEEGSDEVVFKSINENDRFDRIVCKI